MEYAMKSISMTAYRRPEYENQVLESVIPQIAGTAWQFYQTYDREPPDNYGCDRNTLFSISRAFLHGSEFNLHIEDDTVLSPDALDLCDWFWRLPERDDYVLLNLFAYSKSLKCAVCKGVGAPWNNSASVPCTVCGGLGNRGLDVLESARFNSWGWAITRGMWEKYLLPEWNAKKQTNPMGWDWSVGLTIQRHGLKTLHPALSRVKNIGRENGTYETPEHWDSWAKDLVASPGGFGKEFRITERIAEMPPVDGWVTEELELAARG
jgi:hypothetical protein